MENNGFEHYHEYELYVVMFWDKKEPWEIVEPKLFVGVIECPLNEIEEAILGSRNVREEAYFQEDCMDGKERVLVYKQKLSPKIQALQSTFYFRDQLISKLRREHPRTKVYGD